VKWLKSAKHEDLEDVVVTLVWTGQVNVRNGMASDEVNSFWTTAALE
jgi:hypothetical protein